jgi:hypothetical protein
MDNSSDLKLLLASRTALLFVEMRDEEPFMRLLRSAAAPLGLSVWVWSGARGLARDHGAPLYDTVDLGKALRTIAELDEPAVYVLADAHHALDAPTVVRRLKELVGSSQRCTFVVTGPSVHIPPELQGLAASWRLKPPSVQELTELVQRSIEDLRARGFPVTLTHDDVAGMAEALRGMSTSEAERLIQRAALRDGSLGADDVGFLRQEKAGSLEETGAVQLIEADVGTLDDVGGLDRLKAWLELRGRALEPQARDFGLEPPKGVLIVGVPGCGKSLCAKTIARTWQLPMLLLDVGGLYGPYVGESEQRLARALETVEAMAPAVLWIDEIEKGFASSGGDGGVSQRLLGTFLRWLQERPSGIFIVATANDVESLPPELLRKGRFDETFFVDLPDEAARAQIFRAHLRRRERDPDGFDLTPLVEASDGFSGAEIEAAIVGGLYRAYAHGTPLTTVDILSELIATVPLSRTRAEAVGRLRSWAAERAVPADDPAVRIEAAIP